MIDMTFWLTSRIGHVQNRPILIVGFLALVLFALEHRSLCSAQLPAVVPAMPEEPLAKSFSLERAAHSLDVTALAWKKERGCCQCHANLMYLVARPMLAKLVPAPPDVREQFEALAKAGSGVTYATGSTVVGVPLAFHDRQTTGKLHPQTRKMLDLMLSRQRPDGGWTNIGGGHNPVINDYEETLLAALGIAHAPDGYAKTAAAQKALIGIRKYVKGRPAQKPYEKGMLLWAAKHVDGLMTDPERDRAVADLLALQRADGGWALERLTLNKDTKDSDGYGTGFVIFVTSQAGVKANDPRLRKGIAWLKSNQRQSGRWFTRSPGGSKQNLHSNAGTAFAVLALHACGEIPLQTSSADWPQFRGPNGQGHSTASGLPLTWSETENIAWKVPIPGRGNSSPVVQGEQIWLTTALDDGRSLCALCLDRTTSKRLHTVVLFGEVPPQSKDPQRPHANPTPIIEDGRVYAHFGGYGTACVATDGKILWKTQLPHTMVYCPSSTPVLYKDLLIVPCHGNVCYSAALDKYTGAIRWKQNFNGAPSDSTPLLIHTKSGDQLICNLAHRVIAYDPLTGKEVWSVQQAGYANVPRPVFGHGLVFVCGGYMAPDLHAIRPDGRGDVTKTHIAWDLHKTVPQNASPLLVEDKLYLVSDKVGIASCLDARTGKLYWRQRLEGTYFASPVYGDGRIYFTSEEGLTTVIAPGATFRPLAENRLDGRTLASLAVAGREIYLRTDQYLYRIEKN